MGTLFRNTLIKFPITNDEDCLVVYYNDKWRILKITRRDACSEIDIFSPKYDECVVIETFESSNECDICLEKREDAFYFVHNNKNVVVINELGYIESIHKRSQILFQDEEAL
jgi:hypothetical protein